MYNTCSCKNPHNTTADVDTFSCQAKKVSELEMAILASYSPSPEGRKSILESNRKVALLYLWHFLLLYLYKVHLWLYLSTLYTILSTCVAAHSHNYAGGEESSEAVVGSWEEKVIIQWRGAWALGLKRKEPCAQRLKWSVFVRVIDIHWQVTQILVLVCITCIIILHHTLYTVVLLCIVQLIQGLYNHSF